MQPDRYHPLQAVLHWLSAAAILFALFMGMFSLSRIPNAETANKIFALRGHMALGIVIGAIMLLRLALRLTLAQPAPARSGSIWRDRLARTVHYGMYLAALGMAASGIAMALQTGLPGIVYAGSGAALPESFDALVPRRAHGVFARALFVLVALHLAGALYHQLVRRDRLMARMRLGRRA
ncbi:MAG: cytochrome b/b6 domain-containing protein [Burkholderiales bacterium]|nr:cytochrome b/b6 domain-containing protein [Burkholderiales bacterium]